MKWTDTLGGKLESQRVFYLLIGTCFSGPESIKKLSRSVSLKTRESMEFERISGISLISLQIILYILFASSENRSQSKGGSSGHKFTICEEM